MKLPAITHASILQSNRKRLYIAAYGFEHRSLGWGKHQHNNRNILTDALIVNYDVNTKVNKIKELKNLLRPLGVDYPQEIIFNLFDPQDIENKIEDSLANVNDYDEVVLDITALAKFLILIFLCKLSKYNGTLRIVYSEAIDYAPSEADFESHKIKQNKIAHFPNQGASDILSARCLGSIRMQGQPVCLIAFTSFNEQLIRHILGTMNPYRLILINCRPPHNHFNWRERATQYIHKGIIKEYSNDNPINSETGLMKLSTSTLDYTETFFLIDKLYSDYGLYERIIFAATGSKMQTVGLFISKLKHLDIHIEYPTPDSWFSKGLSTGIKTVHEITFASFSIWVEEFTGRKINL